MAEEEPPPTTPIDRNTFEDQYPVMFQFYRERGRLSDDQLQKVAEIQSRWKAGLVFWLTPDNKVIEIPEWVAMNVVINNKTNIFRSSRICMSLNHTKGYGCNRLAEGTCSYIHECVLCGQADHGVFQKKPNGSLICKRLRKWNEEEERFKTKHGDTSEQEDKLSELAQRGREAARAGSGGTRSSAPASTVPTADSLTVEQSQKVRALLNSTGCTEQQALRLLSACRWNLQLAADTYFEGGGEVSPSTTKTASAWGLPAAASTAMSPISRGGSAVQRQSPQEARRPPEQTPEEDRLAAGASATSPSSAESSPPPAPSHPPPPRLPANWQALWSEQHQLYYFWHVPTNETTWEAPALDAAVVEASRLPSVSEPKCASNEPATLSPAVGIVESLGLLHMGEHQEAYRQMDDSAPGHERHKACCSDEDDEEEIICNNDGHYLCTQHWWPPEGIETCMRLFHGEHVTVTWTDGKDNGWAYGHILGDRNQEGYFPQQVLAQVRRAPRRRKVGAACCVAEPFEAPEGVGGYLTVAPGDILKVLYPMEKPCVWAYVESGLKAGWVPEAILSDSCLSDHSCQTRGPHPAG
mmetsp:Transcript_18174/g.33415  ORF Transcript_18174/g.33415 Transcript_18174/m.33415 type:complete len:581 (-) Transcript_18174:114-1856(-)